MGTVLPSTVVNIHDPAGRDTAGDLVVTRLELYSGNFGIAGHYVAEPTMWSSQFFHGAKDQYNNFVIYESSVLTANWGRIDGNHVSAMGYASGNIVGNIDYDAGRIVIDGQVTTNADGHPLGTRFHLVFYFAPGPLPHPVVAVTPGPGTINLDASGSWDQFKPITDFVWYFGDVVVEDGYLNSQDVIGYGPSIDVNPQWTSEVTLRVVAEDGRNAVTTVCLQPNGCN